ncbi:MAG TPA: NADH-quinone oxidoreductase subunit J [Polyangiaceae bacterium]|nr:NADH-quinone oxidoreductase subunit J [Polyangiaceae bacterium]
MTAGNLLFIVCSIACLVGALTTVASQNPIRGAMGLLTTIFGIAGLFLKLRAEFLTAIQLIVYAGAVVVLFVFVLMLLGPDARAPARPGRSGGSRAFGGVLFVLTSLAALISVVNEQSKPTPLGRGIGPDHGTVEAVGRQIFGSGLFAFELVTALLIVAVVGAIAVARGRQGASKSKKSLRSPRDFFAGPPRPRIPGSQMAFTEGKRPVGSEAAE